MFINYKYPELGKKSKQTLYVKVLEYCGTTKIINLYTTTWER